MVWGALALFAAHTIHAQEASGNASDKTWQSQPIEIAGGRVLVFCPKKPLPSTTNNVELLIHFHGAPQTSALAMEKSGLHCIFVLVNFNGLSDAYAKPFRDDKKLFEKLLEIAGKQAETSGFIRTDDWTWRRIAVSTFSAGFGAAREILKSEKISARIDALLTADSIYAGLDPDAAGRRPREDLMRDFLKFAQLAVADKKTMVVTHSAQKTTNYGSTTETADYLLQSLSLDRKPVNDQEKNNIHAPPGMRLRSTTIRNGFTVMGFDGIEGADHLLHLRNIEHWWPMLGLRLDEEE